MVTLKGEAKQQYVAELFTGIARRYDLMNDLMTWRMHRRWKSRLAQVATVGLQPGSGDYSLRDYGLGDYGLDVATGTGDIAARLARRGGLEGVVGVDLLPGMLGLASSKARNYKGSAMVDFTLGDAFSLPFGDSRFACCTAGFSLRNMPSNGVSDGMDGIQKALAEMVRVVRPGGRVATLELTPMKASPLSRLIRWYFHHIVPMMGQTVARDRPAYTYLPQSVDNFPNAQRLQELFKDAGLEPTGFETLGMGAVAIHWGDKPTPNS